jgi:hypothetical protein
MYHEDVKNERKLFTFYQLHDAKPKKSDLENFTLDLRRK